MLDDEGDYTIQEGGVASVLNNVLGSRAKWARALRDSIWSISLNLSSTGRDVEAFDWKVVNLAEISYGEDWEYEEDFLNRLGLAENVWHHFKFLYPRNLARGHW